MKIKVEIDCEDAALSGAGRQRELQRILREAEHHLPELFRAVKKIDFAVAKGLMDINGNRVGQISVEP